MRRAESQTLVNIMINITLLVNKEVFLYLWVLNTEASLVTHVVKSLPAIILETWVRYLDWEDAWRRKWQPTPVILPGKSIPQMEEPGELQSMGLHRDRHD